MEISAIDDEEPHRKMESIALTLRPEARHDGGYLIVPHVRIEKLSGDCEQVAVSWFDPRSGLVELTLGDGPETQFTSHDELRRMGMALIMTEAPSTKPSSAHRVTATISAVATATLGMVGITHAGNRHHTIEAPTARSPETEMQPDSER